MNKIHDHFMQLFWSFLTLTAPVTIKVNSIEKNRLKFALCFIEEITVKRVSNDIIANKQ